jgi:hypothetical protein
MALVAMRHSESFVAFLRAQKTARKSCSCGDAFDECATTSVLGHLDDIDFNAHANALFSMTWCSPPARQCSLKIRLRMALISTTTNVQQRIALKLVDTKTASTGVIIATFAPAESAP